MTEDGDDFVRHFVDVPEVDFEGVLDDFGDAGLFGDKDFLRLRDRLGPFARNGWRMYLLPRLRLISLNFFQRASTWIFPTIASI